MKMVPDLLLSFVNKKGAFIAIKSKENRRRKSSSRGQQAARRREVKQNANRKAILYPRCHF